MLSPLTPSTESLVPMVVREALLVSSDLVTVRTLQQIFADLSVETSVAGDAHQARRLLAEHRFDGVIVDWDSAGSDDVLRVLRANHLTRWAIALALVSDPADGRAAFNLGVNFTLEKPLNPARTARILHTARGMMNIPRRRATRVRVRCEAHYHIEGLGDFRGQGVDLSEGGIAVQGTVRIPARGRARVSFVLPHTDRRLQLEAHVIWADREGGAGFRFLNMTPAEHAALSGWVKRSSAQDHVPERRARRR